MRWQHLGVLLLAVSNLADAQPVVDMSEYYGLWRLSPQSALQLPPACRTATYEITPTTITTRTGQLVITASYKVVGNSEDPTFRQHDLEDNGLPNCQDIPADYVVKNFIMDLEMDIVEGRLRVYFPTRASRNFVEFIRASNTTVGAT